ncbi:nitric oxide reductase activation protein NorD [Desulfonema magnum]|uniref:von Willebrand factor domain-containing protein n=1 Tax=Desulfonema magnum TaxID=45655 RepID=A0A975BT48_9BACT|nr:hypothetical protein [Desulfonema magnum]QTA90918.1 von Willebrand factor domain-containing protein [Desulfonema magnum]
MEYPIQQLSFADPELAETVAKGLKQKVPPVSLQDTTMLVDEIIWGLSQEITFGNAIAAGYVDLIGETSSYQIQEYRRLIHEAGQNGPTLGRIMATYLVPVLKHGHNGFLEHFLHTLDVMQTKGTYTLTSPLESLSSLLNSGDTESASGYLNLLCDTFSQDMSYNQSLHLTQTLPRAILSFSSSKRSWQTGQFRRVIKTDFRLADPFIEGMKKGLHLLSEQGLSHFVSLGLEKFSHHKDLGIKFLSLESKLGIDAYTEMVVTVSVSQVRPRLNRYLRARTGIPISICPLSALRGRLSLGKNNGQQTADSSVSVFSDGKFIYLPDEISTFPTKAENIALYKCLTKLESAYYEFGTFDFDLEKLETGNWKLETGISNPQFPIPKSQTSHLNDLECFFSCFPIKSLASDLFTVFEHGRLRMMLTHFYPGIVRQFFPLLQEKALRIYKENKPVELLFLLYGRIALGVSAEPFFDIRNILLKTQVSAITELFERKMEEDISVEACAALVFQTYHDMENLIRKMSACDACDEFYTPLKTPFGRKVRPDVFFSTYGHFERIAEAIKVRLEKRGIKTYKSDIRKHLIQNNGNISRDDIREIVLYAHKNTESDTGPCEEPRPDLSWLNLAELLGHSDIAVTQDIDASGPVSWYREWDSNLGDYLHNHVRLLERPVTASKTGDEKKDDFYVSTLKCYQGLVKQIRHAFELLKPDGLTILRQWPEGDAFDYRALLDFAVDKKAGITPSDRLYIKRLKQQRDVAVLLLVDLSRSTSNLVSGSQTSVLDVEKEAIVLFCEALEVVGDTFGIAGFSGTGRLGADYFRIKDFDEDMNDEVKQRISLMAPQRSTRMGVAIRHAVCQIEKVSAKVRLLIILGDGFPNDTDYKREYAIADTRRAISEARSKSILARAITVNLAGDSKLDDLYGSLHHNVISDVRELPDKLLRIYSALTR